MTSAAVCLIWSLVVEEREAFLAFLETQISWYIVHTFRYQERVAEARRKAGFFK